MPTVTPELVNQAYGALATGDRATIEQYWANDMVWLVPGHHQLAGSYRSLDEFLNFMGKVGGLTENSFRMDGVTVLTNDEYSADVTHNTGHRAGENGAKLDIDVIHLLRWRDGKVIEGRGAIFGDGTSLFNTFWGNT